MTSSEIDWEKAAKEWFEFLETLNRVRNQIGCSNAHAWFRGCDSSHYNLLPSLFRRQPIQDNLAQIGDIEALWRSVRVVNDTSRGSEIFSKFEETPQNLGLNSLGTKFPNEVRRFKRAMKAVRKAHEPGNGKGKRALYTELVTATVSIKQCCRVPLMQAPLEVGEYDVYSEFSQRYEEEPVGGSWGLLAAMQHFGVGTRLLDWTDSLIIALGFALDRYYKAFSGLSIPRNASQLPEPKKHAIEWSGNGEGIATPETITTKRPLEPIAIWVLNPYRLARQCWGKPSVPNVEVHPSWDYSTSILTSTGPSEIWPFDMPLPMFIPWRNRRIRAQRGAFTVHGADPNPLDMQLGLDSPEALGSSVVDDDRMLGMVTLEPMGAVYALSLIRDAHGIDEYALYRDPQLLADRVDSRHLKPKPKA